MLHNAKMSWPCDGVTENPCLGRCNTDNINCNFETRTTIQYPTMILSFGREFKDNFKT